jgi:hypothetical protein
MHGLAQPRMVRELTVEAKQKPLVELK